MAKDTPGENNTVACKNCASTATVKYGKYRKQQYYWCKSCHRKFQLKKSGFHMKMPSAEITSCLNLYYTGTGIEEIRTLLRGEYRHMPSKMSVFKWVEKYSALAAQATGELRPTEIGDIWIADETVIRIGGEKVWIFDIQDEKTRFLLATRITVLRSSADTRLFLQQAYQKAGLKPATVITDSFISYLINGEKRMDAWQVPVKSMNLENDARRIDLFHATLKDRTTIMKRLKSLEAANRLMSGWTAYYNFLRANEAAGGRIPAEAAGILAGFRSWEEIINGATYKKTGIQVVT
jgi:putative transposase